VTETVLEEAIRITSQDRNRSYGHPADHFSRTIGAINAVFTDKVKERLARGEPMFDVLDWPKILTLDKVARGVEQGYHRDSVTDRAGYARTEEMAHDELERRALVSPPTT
jgi:hypothetical protein